MPPTPSTIFQGGHGQNGRAGRLEREVLLCPGGHAESEEQQDVYQERRDL